ncbi:MAG: ribosome-associated translation inhibitor RaiA [Pseudomonadota bacterium]|nr:ribosome-associated translation inhibitor RaiA [Pseudomonadota bacterium]
MQLIVSGQNIDVTESLKTYAQTKFERLERHFDQITSATAILGLESNLHHAEVTLHVKGNDLFADAKEDDMYKAIDATMHKLDRQLIKHKEKLVARQHGS